MCQLPVHDPDDLQPVPPKTDPSLKQWAGAIGSFVSFFVVCLFWGILGLVACAAGYLALRVTIFAVRIVTEALGV